VSETEADADRQTKVVLLRQRCIGIGRWALGKVPDKGDIEIEVADEIRRELRQPLVLVCSRLFIEQCHLKREDAPARRRFSRGGKPKLRMTA
jgi:hypothetical protein